jgi:hypothetical protein
MYTCSNLTPLVRLLSGELGLGFRNLSEVGLIHMAHAITEKPGACKFLKESYKGSDRTEDAYVEPRNPLELDSLQIIHC